MYTITVLCLFIAFLVLYNTSRKNSWVGKPRWAAYLEKQKMLSVAISLLLMVVSLAILLQLAGVTSGIFAFLVILMAMGNVIVLLFPFRYMSPAQVFLLVLVFFVFEQLIF